jgi:phosphate transport system permease protein
MVEAQKRGPKKTRKWVLVADKLADRSITVGGILVIGAVILMMVYLIFEVMPLFRGNRVESSQSYKVNTSDRVLTLSIDDYKTIAAAFDEKGLLTVWHARNGITLGAVPTDLKGKNITSFAKTADGTDIALGFSDGTIRTGRIDFSTEILQPGQIPQDLKKIDEIDSTDGLSVYSKIPGKQIRKITPNIKLDDELQVSEAGKPIIAIDYRLTQFGERPKKTIATIDEDGAPAVSVAESKPNLFTRKVTTKVEKVALPKLEASAPITHALVTDNGEEVFFADEDSKIYRYDLRDFDKPEPAETVNLLPAGVKLGSLGFLLGERSIVVGGSDGSVNIFFLLRRPDAKTKDGYELVKTRVFDPQERGIKAFAASQRGKTFAVVDAGGRMWIRHGTSEKTLFKLDAAKGARFLVALAPRLDGAITLTDNNKAHFWDLNMPHPEISLKTLFGKVWYEGYPEPTYTWQSTGGSDEFEPKLSLVPLIFGTFKGTVYSLLFAIPIALLGAIYTSEFLPHEVQARVKPVMEVMASIPSVVLGFVAALVLAPIVENWIAAILLSFGVLPMSLVFAAYLWQLLPPPVAVRFEGVLKFCFMFVVVGLALYAAYFFGPLFEKIFFYGDFKAWSNGSIGGPAPFLFLMVFPFVIVGLSWVFSRVWGFRFLTYIRTVAMPYSALIDLARWIAIVASAILTSYVAAVALQAVGIDPRGAFVGTYVQRNTLIVGFAMGFAVIPLIYTLAEDALSAVPEHLRSASLGCGATLWQTAIWIVLPTAISGVFSAVMIGMGRAVGETMIVVMSAGNTPLLDWNIFNGLRALSANIAVELPEAPKDATLYRVLFLTGLVLFGMTFLINTVAELVRLRFRKRAMQL